MLRRHLLMAGTAIAMTAVMVGGAMAQATVVRIVAGDLVPDDPASETYIKNIEAGGKAMDGSDIDLQIVPIAASSYADKLSALLLGGDIPDLIYFQGGDQKMVEQGILADLNPLIANTKFLKNELYGHNVERMKNYPYLVYDFPPRAPQPVIRTDWLEKLGGKKPETVDDYTALFQAIHDGDLDGDGTPGNTLGLTAYVNTNELDDIFNQAFGVTGTWMKDASGQWVAARVTEQEKAKIAYYADLAAKGLFDKEYVTNKFDVKEDKFYTGKAGVIFGSSAETVGIYGEAESAAGQGLGRRDSKVGVKYPLHQRRTDARPLVAERDPHLVPLMRHLHPQALSVLDAVIYDVLQTALDGQRLADQHQAGGPLQRHPQLIVVMELAAAAQGLHQIQRLYLLVNVGLFHALQGALHHQFHLVQVGGKLALLHWVSQHLGAQLETGQRGLEIMGHGAEQQVPLVQMAADASLHLIEGMDGSPGLAAPLLLHLGHLALAVEQGGSPRQVADGPYLLAHHPPGGDQDDQRRPQHETQLARSKETGIQALVRGRQGRRQIEPGAGRDGNLDHQDRRI